MFLYNAVLKTHLSRSGLNSRCGEKLLGIRQIYISVLFGTKKAFIPFRAQLPMWGKITWD